MKDEKSLYNSIGLEIVGAIILALILQNGLGLDIPTWILVPILFVPVHYLNVLNKKHQEKSKAQ